MSRPTTLAFSSLHKKQDHKDCGQRSGYRRDFLSSFGEIVSLDLFDLSKPEPRNISGLVVGHHNVIVAYFVDVTF